MNNIISALNSLNPAELSYQDWLEVGMALHSEGYDCSIWDSWSRNDKRYHEGECDRKWRSFRGCASPVTGGTIIKMAKERGWSMFGENGAMAWDDSIEYDGAVSSVSAEKTAANPSEQLIAYLETLFKEDEFVGYVTGDVWQTEDGRYCPSKGVYNRTAGEIISELRKHGDDLGAAIGDWKSEAGAWIRFNPLDGKGVKNDNVTRFSYALVESDTMPIQQQYEMYRKLQLPIACLVHSGGKSLHAIVKVDAKDSDEYRRRVDFLYDFLAKNGLTIDRQNRNPSRLSRMPGVTRNGNYQALIARNIGRKSWSDWMDYVDSANDSLPALVTLESYRDDLPTLPEELIKGVLRCGHKMLISGSSKAGKSFLLMELCIALAEGKPWLGFHCRKSRVLYINLEIDPASCIMRFMKIYEALKWERKHMDDIVIWNLRGYAEPLDHLVPKLLRRMQEQHFDAVIIDPIYKVITGDENNASEMGYFTNQFDKICSKTGSSVIYCHHHSKGAQGAKKAMDRASGSGVFARDPDAQLDMIELELTDDILNNVRDGSATAWRLECSLREFEGFKPIEFWFDYPIHRLDLNGDLATCSAECGMGFGRLRSKKSSNTLEQRHKSVENSYYACAAFQTPVTVTAMAEYAGVSQRCMRDRIKDMPDTFWIRKGTVGLMNDKWNGNTDFPPLH